MKSTLICGFVVLSSLITPAATAQQGGVSGLILKDGQHSLSLKDPEPALPISILDAYPRDLTTDFQNDLVIIGTGDSLDKSGKPVFTATGSLHVDLVLDANSFLTLSAKAKAEPTAGLPGTRLNITQVKQAIPFMGKCWLPSGAGDSFIIVTKERVIGVHVKIADPGKPTTPKACKA